MNPQLPLGLDTLNLYGFYVPSLMLCAVVACAVCVLLSWALRHLGFYRYVWHRALFDIALYVLILSGIVLAGGPG